MTRRPAEDRAARAAAEARSCIALRARRLARVVTKLFEDALRGHGITVAQFTLLAATVLDGPLQPARLGRMLDLDKSTLSRNLKVLEAAGLVRLGHADEGAGLRVSVTEHGQRALVDALPAWRAAQEAAVAALGGVGVARLDGMIAALGQRPRPRSGAGR